MRGDISITTTGLLASVEVPAKQTCSSAVIARTARQDASGSPACAFAGQAQAIRKKPHSSLSERSMGLEDVKKPHALSRMGLGVRSAASGAYLPERVPTTSTSTRRFLARPSRVALSAT